MTVTTTDKWWGEKLKIVQKENESLKQELLEKFKEEYEQEEEGGRARLKIAGKGGSPGQPYDDPEKGKGPFVPAPPRDKLASLQIRPTQIMLPFVPKEAETDDMYGEGVDEIEGLGQSDLARANNIRSFQEKGYQLNIPLHDWKQIPPGIRNDPDFIDLHLRRMPALGINPMLAREPQLPNFKPMGRVIKGVRKGVLSPEENKIKQALQIRGA